MLWTIFVILLVLWILGMVTSYTIGGSIHVLLVLAEDVLTPAKSRFQQSIRMVAGRSPIRGFEERIRSSTLPISPVRGFLFARAARSPRRTPAQGSSCMPSVARNIVLYQLPVHAGGNWD